MRSCWGEGAWPQASPARPGQPGRACQLWDRMCKHLCQVIPGTYPCLLRGWNLKYKLSGKGGGRGRPGRVQEQSRNLFRNLVNLAWAEWKFTSSPLSIPSPSWVRAHEAWILYAGCSRILWSEVQSWPISARHRTFAEKMLYGGQWGCQQTGGWGTRSQIVA